MIRFILLFLPLFFITELCGQEIKETKIINPNDDSTYIVSEKHPEFPGGQIAMRDYLQNSLRYPENDREKNIQGLVIVNFVVEKNGSLSNVNILRGVTPTLDAEAMRVVEAMPAWIPGEQDGEVVRVSINLPIRFTLHGRLPKNKAPKSKKR